MTEDFVRRKGYLTLGTRLKRIGDRLQADVQQLNDAMDIPLQAGQYPLVAVIHERGPLTIGEIADSLGVKQPGVTRSVNQLMSQKIVTVVRGNKDQRTKVVALTEAGRVLVERGQRDVWPLINGGLADICGDTTASLLDQLDNLEYALNEQSLFKRITQEKMADDNG